MHKLTAPLVTCSKEYSDLPFAHRQPNHDGHCALVHGHNFGFKITFAAKVLDDCGFVIDFGKLKWLKAWLESQFDHTLVLNATDPVLPYLQATLGENNATGAKALAKIIVVPDCSAEGLASWVLAQVGALVDAETAGRVYVLSVVCQEDEKNAATVSNRLEP